MILGSSSGSESDSESEEKSSEEEKDESVHESDEDMDVFANDESVKLRNQQDIYSNLFKNCVFFLGREVPKVCHLLAC